MGTPAECIDHSICQKMEELVEQLTTSGKPVLNAEKMKQFKNLCRISDMYVKHAYHQVLIQLKKEHAEIRLSAFQMMDELFNRSHQFRELLINDFQDFLDLVVETDPELPLPPPKSAAKTLKSSAYKSIQQWYTKFGDAYMKLGLGYTFLKNCKKVDFDDIMARSIAERKREEEKERKRQENLKRKMLVALKEMEDSIQDISLCLLEAENCFQLLLPSPDEFFISNSCHGDLDSSNRKAQKVSSAKEKSSTPVDSELEQSANARCGASSFNAGNDSSSNQQVNSNSSRQENKAMPASKSEKSDKAVFPKHLNDTYCKSNSVNESHGVLSDSEQENSLTGVDINRSQSDRKEKEASAFILQKERTDYQNKKFNQFEMSPYLSQSIITNSQNSDLKKLIRTGKVCEVGLSVSCTNSEDTNKTDEAEHQSSESSTKEEDKMDKSVHSDRGDDDDNELNSSGDDSKYVDVGWNPLRTEYRERGSMVKEHGLGSSKYQISIQVEPAGVSVKKNADNQFIIQTLQDQYRLISTKFLPSIKRWIQEITKAGGSDRDVKKAIDLKTKLENCKRKCLELDLVPADRGNIESSDTDEDEFEEVQEKEGYEPIIPSHLRAEYGLEPLKPDQSKSKPKSKSSYIPAIKGKTTKSDWNLKNRVEEEDELDPTSYKANIKKIVGTSSGAPTSTVTFEMLSSENSTSTLGMQTKPNPSSSDASTTTLVDQKELPSRSGSENTVLLESRKKKLLEEAPNVKFGVDLEYWENPDKIEAPLVVNLSILDLTSFTQENRFDCISRGHNIGYTWQPVLMVEEEPGQPPERTTNPQEATGKLSYITTFARMNKCPFHGKIIARNDLGQPCDPQDIEKLVKEEATKQNETVPDWQDPELLADIEAATGVDLGSKRQRKGQRRKGKGKAKTKEKKYPDLTDISAIKNTARSRLEAKVLSKSSLKRVCTAMDQIAYKRIRDKFGNQFHYAYPK